MLLGYNSDFFFYLSCLQRANSFCIFGIVFHQQLRLLVGQLINRLYTQFREYYIIIIMFYEQQSSPLLQSARQNFVKKVYATLSIQLVVTVCVVYLSMQSRKFLKFLINNTWFFWTNFIGSIVTLLALFFANITRKVPINYGVMGLFTICESFMVAYVCMYYTPSSVLLTSVATLSATLGLTYYAMTTKQDFTSFRFIGKGIFYSLSWIVLTVSLVNFFFLRSGIIAYGLSILFAIIYSVYLLIDTQMILGRGEKKVKLDDYILGATIIYMDIISLFLKLLRLLGKKKDE